MNTGATHRHPLIGRRAKWRKYRATDPFEGALVAGQILDVQYEPAPTDPGRLYGCWALQVLLDSGRMTSVSPEVTDVDIEPEAPRGEPRVALDRVRQRLGDPTDEPTEEAP